MIKKKNGNKKDVRKNPKKRKEPVKKESIDDWTFEEDEDIEIEEVH